MCSHVRGTDRGITGEEGGEEMREGEDEERRQRGRKDLPAPPSLTVKDTGCFLLPASLTRPLFRKHLLLSCSLLFSCNWLFYLDDILCFGCGGRERMQDSHCMSPLGPPTTAHSSVQCIPFRIQEAPGFPTRGRRVP